MKTVKRKANVGEHILITNVPSYEHRYRNGTVGIVGEVAERGNVIKADFGGVLCNVLDTEYEVIIENKTELEVVGVANGIIEQMQAEIAELKTKVATLEGIKYTTDLPEGNGVKTWVREVYKSPQEIRDDIVAQAKRDVADLENGNHKYGNSFDYVIDQDKRTVVALGKITSNGKVALRGIAKCDPSDCFNASLGRAISLRRALGLEVPAEYYSAPAPTEVRVGDVINYVGGTRGDLTVISDNEILGNSEIRTYLCVAESSDNPIKFIDDSRD